MKKLFIYYSLTGNGDLIAENLKNKKGIAIRKVQTLKKFPKFKVAQILKCGFLASINSKAKLKDFDSNLKGYDEIIIGSPIWNARLSTPINTVLDELDLSKKKLTFVLYSGSGSAPKAVDKITELYPDAKIICTKEPKNKKKDLDKTLIIV